ncbi:M16 family metallopeptidase [Glaciecola sp. 2405UD65-10]|uniref:M16 family metallopeptidase n=1 Tax=Glaciecola sp. 2405UD65-10 TaxID=3397244 RepID=UPI003B5C0AE9
MISYKKLTIALASSLILVACSDAPSNNSSINGKPIELAGDVIKYHKYELNNGLTVVLHPDSSDPLVNVNVTYHVGSAREDYGRSGFAHFFEHMMFQGSQHVADEEHFKIITEAGGSLNGTTNTDRTNYFETVPANQLEKMLWLEADRMGFLLPAVTQAKFETQRETVKNERGQRVDNQPYGLRSERTAEALYPKGHPYSWSTIGYVEDLDRVNVEDLKAFFKRWYGPNNAVLTIGGDIDIPQTKTWIEKYFGPIPKGPEVTPAEKQPASLNESRYITLEDKVHLPLLQLTYPTVYRDHDDEPALDVLANILGQGKTSLLYKNMVKNGLAVQAFANHPCKELACEFVLLSLANPQNVSDLESLSEIMQTSLAEFEERGVQDDDLQRVKSAIESNSINALQSVSGKVNMMASSQIFRGEPDTVSLDIERYNQVTKDDVMRVYNQYIKDKAAVVLSIVPNGQTELAVAAQNFSLDKRVIPLNGKQVAEFEAPSIVDAFDRSVMPKASANKAVSVPEFWEHTFDNGIKVLGVQTTEAPTLSISLSMEGGVLLDNLDKLGVASLTAQLLNESTQAHSTEEIANKLSLLGSAINFSANGRYMSVEVNTLSKYAQETLVLLEDKLLSPGFTEADFDLVKQRTLQGMQQSLKNPSVLASRGRNMLLYSDQIRLGLPDSGTLESIKSITLDDVKEYYNKYVRPNHATLVAVGDMDKSKVLDLTRFLSKWESKDYMLPTFEYDTQIEKGKIYIVDNPGSVQSVVNIFRHAPVYDPYDEYFKLSLANFTLGGMFNSRINLNLREDKGYSYGARSRFSGGKTTGTFVASADVTAEFTKESIQEFLNEINMYQEKGMSQEELVFLQSAYTQSDALRYETPSQKARFLMRLLSLDLDKDYTAKQQDIIENIKIDELNALAAKWLDTDKMHILVVGDANTLKESLKAFGKEIEIITVPQ